MVSLAVTIIVLLILSGITISTLLGDNGIIKQAKRAAELTKRSTVVSSVQLDILMAEMEGEITQEKLEEILNKYGTIEKNDAENPDKVTGLKVEGVTDSIPIEELYPEETTGGGNTPTPSIGTGADDIANETDKSKYYGKEVDYTVGDSTLQSGLETDGIKWRIFYAGSDFSADGKSHIYLITDDYVAVDKLPYSTNTSGAVTSNKPNSNSATYPKGASLSNIINDYTGSENITNQDIKKLNSDYFITKGYTSTKDNMKAVAYMCDTTAWSGYKGVKAYYAIGGPTVEMLLKSYNQLYGVNYKARANTATSGNTGYELSKDGGTNWAHACGGILSTSDNLYVNDASKTNAWGYWLSSPSTYGDKYLGRANYGGNVDHDNYSNSISGFRPLVCLSADAKLEEQADGTFKIVDTTSDTTAADIANATNKSEYYGKTVTGYTCTNSSAVANWKIFYAGSDFSADGNSHIYLIADDYIARTAIPKSSAGHTLNDGSLSYPKAAHFTNILEDYTGSASITDNNIKKLNNDYFNTKKYTSTWGNMKAVAYMCDTNAWNGYKGAKADYAIGGPTVEMLMKSYSQAHSVDYRAQASYSVGYQISKDGGSSWELSIESMLSTRDSLYVILSQTNACGFWLASPSAGDSSTVVCVDYNGCVDDVGYNDYGRNGLGFRPLVCLSSDVKLEQQSNGTFRIK